MTPSAAVHPVQQAVVDAFSPAARHDPYPAYDVLRAAGPFVPGPHGTQLVTRHADCEAILADPSWSHAEEPALLHPDSDVELAGSFLWLEPPDHTRLRRLVSAAFTPRRIERMRARAVELVDGLLDSALAAGEVDLIESLAYPLPLTMVCDLLGVPAGAHADVRRMSAGIARGLDPDALLTPAELDARTRAVQDFAALFTELIGRRRAHPRQDLITALAQVEADRDTLSEHELLGTLLILVVAGHETTVNLIGNGLLGLLRHPDQFARLRADPDLALPAVDEMLRHDPPVHLTTRTARAELTVGGRVFAPGDAVIVLLGSANRDPEAFARPAELDLSRYAGEPRPRRHLAFGLGLHYCLGASLARLEMEAVLRAVATRVGRCELLAEPLYRPNLVVRGMSELVVRLQEESTP
ncbi:cytochrome P450 [Pseudonocardia abyssalis]|uniref:Cytochrome P450 n=1 Tax=Pseudonocardia abyssalis TaxID=2792008 RepID=A0ABS6UNM3_9PSEU|nr:cytochrome P450 [Pseudonocardia abyssalis]MBW0118075.1 cytochrome P450 [Pseudonocardia abyssalis]MBW0133850.1 cytochrome P450 [Pseudonocardia abyssalis]